MKKIISLLIAVLLSLSVITPAAASVKEEGSAKEEVVYGLLGTDGSAEKIYVVNIFKGGAITDYGSYSEIKNLTTTEEITRSGDRISCNTNAAKLYYQGTLATRELPWLIKIAYKLDGRTVSSAELAGKSGALEIGIEITQNTKVSKTFFDNYALQLSLQLDSELCTNIVSENAVAANAGGSRQLTYTILPGKGADIKITADVRDFEMAGISINGIKMLLDMDIDYSSITSELTKLTDAAKKLDGGAADLSDGARQLSEGLSAYTDGLKKYKDGLSAFSSGAKDLSKGAAALSGGISELNKQSAALLAGAEAIQQSAFDMANTQLAAIAAERPDVKIDIPELTPENYSLILSNIPELAALKERLDGVLQFTQGLKAYTDGVSQLGEGAVQLENGVSQLSASASVIESSAGELYESAVKLNSAMSALRDGLNAYKEGTGKLKNGASDIGSQIRKKSEELIKGIFGNGDKTCSFVSEKNRNVAAVQFAMKTGAIEKREESAPVARQAEKLNFWQKLLKLFGV
jgi:X-X-X-Leu-X-X-Gly heptad repeat protein